MNALERKVSNMLYDYKQEHNAAMPQFAHCNIRWNDSGEYEDVTVALHLYTLHKDDVKYDDDIFFYFSNANEFMTQLANIDFTAGDEDFDSVDEFRAEVDKYATNDEDSEDWSYLHRGEDFCIVDVEEFFDAMSSPEEQYIRKLVIIDGVAVHIELGHTMNEWERYAEKFDQERADGTTLWSVDFEDFLNGAIEPCEDVLYWYISGRLCETDESI